MEMLKELDPNNKEGPKQKVVVDLVEQCRTYNRRVSHLVNSASIPALSPKHVGSNNGGQRTYMVKKTLRYFPSVMREALSGRPDKRSLAIQTWQQSETTVINQCTQFLSPTADPSYVMTYVTHSFPQHRQYMCAGALILMHGHAKKNINSGNLRRVLQNFLLKK